MDFQDVRKKYVDHQVRPHAVTDNRVIDAFLKVEREKFIPKSKQSIAYSELEIETVEGRALWLARDLSRVLQALDTRPEELALVIGAGEGYSSALLVNLVETVIATEVEEETVTKTSATLVDAGYDRVAMVQADLEAGYPSEGPYDVILVNGATQTIPQAWLDQLAEGGRLGVVHVDGHSSVVRIYTKAGNHVSYRSEFECFPPEFTELAKKPEFSL